MECDTSLDLCLYKVHEVRGIEGPQYQTSHKRLGRRHFRRLEVELALIPKGRAAQVLTKVWHSSYLGIWVSSPWDAAKKAREYL